MSVVGRHALEPGEHLLIRPHSADARLDLESGSGCRVGDVQRIQLGRTGPQVLCRGTGCLAGTSNASGQRTCCEYFASGGAQRFLGGSIEPASWIVQFL